MTSKSTQHRRDSKAQDLAFFLAMGGLSSTFIVLIALMLIADIQFVSLKDFKTIIARPEIQFSFFFTIVTCTLAAAWSLLVATPLAYLLSRFRFPGKWLVEAIVDIPIVLPPLVLGLSLLILFHGNWQIDAWLRDRLNVEISFRWPAVVIAQFAVSCAFAVRTMRITFDQMNPRAEEVARTLGCTRAQAFTKIALPQSLRGIIAAGTIAWSRALGEFGPIMVFAGTTRMRTEVLSTSVFLELSVGELHSAVAISLIMIAMAAVVLLVLRFSGLDRT
jgi:molybdate transport system permease protein